MKDIKERLAKVEEKTDSAHKRINDSDQEIISLRNSRHEQSNMLHNHSGILAGFNNAIERLTESSIISAKETNNNTLALKGMQIRADTVIKMLALFFGFCVTVVAPFAGFVCGKVLHWW